MAIELYPGAVAIPRNATPCNVPGGRDTGPPLGIRDAPTWARSVSRCSEHSAPTPSSCRSMVRWLSRRSFGEPRSPIAMQWRDGEWFLSLLTPRLDDFVQVRTSHGGSP